MLEPNSGVSKEMDKTIAKYLLGEITYKEAVDTAYQIYMKSRAGQTERVRRKND